MRHGTDVVHEVVGGDGLTVEEDPVDGVAHQQLGAGGGDRVHVHQQEHGRQCHGETCHTWK